MRDSEVSLSWFVYKTCLRDNIPVNQVPRGTAYHQKDLSNRQLLLGSPKSLTNAISVRQLFASFELLGMQRSTQSIILHSWP